MKNRILNLIWNLSGHQELTIDANKCVRCKKCVKICPHTAITRSSEGGYMILQKYCVRCYQCKNNCPMHAIVKKE